MLFSQVYSFQKEELLVVAGDFEQVLSTVEPVRVVSDRPGPIYFGEITALVCVR